MKVRFGPGKNQGWSLAALIAAIVLLLPSLSPAFSVATQNLFLHNDLMKERVAHLHAELETSAAPDIIGFQESARWVGRKSLFDRFISLTGFKGIYKNTGQFVVMNNGIALVSRLKSVRLEAVELPREKGFAAQFVTSGIFETENGGRVAVLNTHFTPHAKGLTSRVMQARFILEYLAAFKGVPVIIVGDLNDSYSSQPIGLFREAGFADALDGQGATWDPTTNPLAKDKQFGPSRLDYILFRPVELKVKTARLIFKENWVSDHYGLTADFARQADAYEARCPRDSSRRDCRAAAPARRAFPKELPEFRTH